MNPRNRKSRRLSRGQGPKLDRFGTSEHAAEEPRGRTASGARTSADDIPPLPIDLAKLREAERCLEEDLVAIEALIWSRLQETLRAEDRGGQPRDTRHAQGGAIPGLRSQGRHGNRPRRGQARNRGATSAPQDADQGIRPTASPTSGAELIDVIVQENLIFITRQIAGFGVPPADVADVTQEVLSGVFQALSQYDTSRGKLRTWLYRIAYYQSRSFLGRAYHRREALDAAPPDESSGALDSMRRGVDPEQQAIVNEERRRVWDLIETIEINRRAVLIGYEIMEMSMAEITQVLGIPESTGWGRLQQARREFVRALRKHRARETFASAHAVLANVRKRR